MLHLITDLTRVLLFALYLVFTYKCLLKLPEKKAISQASSLFPVHCGNPKTISARPNAHKGAAALDQLGQPASRKKKVCADAFWGDGSLT
jgi:hypothetical protein